MSNTRLNAFEEYQKMVDSIFGNDIINVDKTKFGNNIIGTWSHKNEFNDFKQNFSDRLKRLQAIYKDADNVTVIHNLVKNIGDNKNWEGIYAELVAYDVMHTEYNAEVKLDVSQNATFALAEKLGKRNVNYDIHMFEDYDVYLDIKAFTDTVGDILKHSVIDAITNLEAFKEYRIDILPEYPYDDDDEDYKKNITYLREELKNALNDALEQDKSKSSFTSAVVPRLSFRILIGEGVNSTVSAYDPYRRAEQLKDMIIKRYCNKLPYDKPFFLVFVNFPWFNQRDRNAFSDCNKVLYRSISRRTFMQYERSETLIRDINPKYISDESAKFAARKLTGMVFIDDLSIKKSSQNIYVYLNPNADNKQERLHTYFHELLRKSEFGYYDDFLHDNY